MIGVSTTPYHLVVNRKFNTWYSIKDGNWDDPSIWMSNGGRKRGIPRAGDDVWVGHAVLLNMSPINVNNLNITGSITANETKTIILTISGNCRVRESGKINLITASHNLVLNGYYNLIPYDSFNAGTLSTVTYNGYLEQEILNIPYRNMYTTGGKKRQNNDIIIAGNLTIQSNYDCSYSDLSVLGSSVIGIVGQTIFTKTASGNLLFIGNVNFAGNIDLSVGNPNVECRGGMTIHTVSFTSGSGVFTFTTNNQTLFSSAYLSGFWNSPIVIQDSITLTLTGNQFTTYNTINGTTSNSKFNNEGFLNIGYKHIPMEVGIFNYQNSTNSTIGYAFNDSYTLPYSDYANLFIAGMGTKKLGASTNIKKDFINNGYFECDGHDLNITEKFSHSGGGTFTTSSFCNITIGGFADFANGVGSNIVDFRNGNPNIEFKNGLRIHATAHYTGTGIFKFSTNNQTINFSAFNSGSCEADFLISGAINVSFLSGGTIPLMKGILNGDHALSTFTNQGTLAYSNSLQPMQVGLLQCNVTTNTFAYSLNGNQDVTGGTYRNLTFNSGGVKKLLGNISVINTFSLIPPATLSTNGYSLTNP